MFAIGIRFLCGWAMATDPADRERPEWPPHPGRVFMALAAAHFETRHGRPVADVEAERAALEWLERLPPPALRVSEAGWRRVVTSYVPVNDVALPTVRADRAPTSGQIRGALALLPESRPRQPRFFPVAIPADPVLYLLWHSFPPEGIADALERVCAGVTYLGHSASLVQVWTESGAEIVPNLVPTPTGEQPIERLRIWGEGRLAQLEAAFAAGLRPSPGAYAGYGPVAVDQADPTPASIFDDRMIILRRYSGRPLGLPVAARLTELLRAAAMSAAAQPPNEILSGHAPDGSPSERPHAAYVPLAFVGDKHASGRILGLAIVLPRGLDAATRHECLAAVARACRAPDPDRTTGLILTLGRIGEWVLVPEDREASPYTLRQETYTRPARRWASVMPIVLDRYSRNSAEQAEIIATSCERIGLPRPVSVVVTPVSAHVGAPPAPAIPPLPARPGKPMRYHVHAVITFARDVRGPVLLGAGRYRGYGLCRPLSTEGGAA